MLDMVKGMGDGTDEGDDDQEGIDISNEQIQKYLDKYITERTLNIQEEKESIR